MNTSVFDPNAFLQATQTEVNERRALLPVDNPESPDGLYLAVIGTVKTDSGVYEKGNNIGKPWVSIVIPMKVDVPQQLQESLKLPSQLTFTDRVFLDLTADGKGVDNSPGKNRGQKNYREALDMNKPGESFSWLMVQGRLLKIKINHELYKGDAVEKIGGIFRAS